MNNYFSKDAANVKKMPRFSKLLADVLSIFGKNERNVRIIFVNLNFIAKFVDCLTLNPSRHE
jgi:hypothetical protein